MLLATLGCRPATPPPAPAPAEDTSGFEPLPPPRSGDWLHSFPEEEQTVGQYRLSCRNRKSAVRTTIYLQPMGVFDERYTKTIEAMREYAEIFFGVPAKVRDPIPLPDKCLIMPRGQYNATMLIDHLREGLPVDALAVAGITNKDLFSNGLNFVFGEGSLAGRRGVYSLVRYERFDSRGFDAALAPRRPDEIKFLWRSLQLLSHEVGHIFSIGHCVKWKCVMCGANSLEEGDRHPLHLCPDDLKKLQWNTDFDVAARYGRLADFYARSGLEAEARWCRDRLAGRRRP